MSSNLVIVAIPDQDDRVWKISSEKVPHLTLLFLGDADQVSNLDQIMLFVEHAASTSLKRFYLPVDHRGELGADKADVLFFKKGRYDFAAVRDFRSLLLKDTNIKTAYDSAQQFEAPKTAGQSGQPWIPHLTLGYPTSPAKPFPDGDWPNFYDVNFNRIAVWTGDFEGPEFLLKDYWDDFDEMAAIPMDVAMSDLQHFGVKGQKWGVRKADDAQAYLRIGDTPKNKKDDRRDARWLKKNLGIDLAAGQVISKSEKKIFDAAQKTLKPDIKALNKSPEFSGKENRKQLKDPTSDLADRYDKAHSQLFAKHMQAAADKHGKTSPSGKWEEKLRVSKKTGSWSVGIRKIDQTARHADMSDMDYQFTVWPIRDENRLIIDYQLIGTVEDASMAQTTELGVEFIEHHGVKGQKWGVRKEDTASGGHIRISEKTNKATISSENTVGLVGLALIMPPLLPLAFISPRLRAEVSAANLHNKNEKADKKWQKQLQSANKAVEVHNKAADEVNQKISEFNSDKRWKNADGTDIHLPSNPKKKEEYDK